MLSRPRCAKALRAYNTSDTCARPQGHNGPHHSAASQKKQLERGLRYAKEHPEQRAAIYIRYNQAHRQDRAEYARRRYWSHPEKAREAVRLYMKQNPEKRAETQRRRYARARGASVVDVFTNPEIFKRDGWRCHICNRRVSRSGASVDHLVPLALGGEHTRANVATAHRRCNSRMGVARLAAQMRLAV